VSPRLAGDVALVVSELVANSVRHAEVGPAESIRLDLRVLGGEVWIAVGDRGSSRLPRITGGFGLRVVDRLARSWGVARDGAGRTLVWCRLALEPSA
jgi:two-component sensor histidine kinase